jgi:hypothetical protein
VFRMIRCIAACSAAVTHSVYLCFTAICRATYAQRQDLFGGSQVAASPSPFCWFGAQSWRPQALPSVVH